MQTDYLIIGQGLAGSTLAWELMQRGCSVMVIDEPTKNKASSIAAGLFNPVTNKVMARTWMAEIFFPFLQEFYSEAEKKLQRKFFYLLPIYRPFISGEERQQWKAKSEDEALRPFVKHFHSSPAFSQQIHNPFGGIEIAYSGYVEVSAWMAAMRDFLQSKEAFRESSFSETDLILREDAIEYQDVRAKRIIFCTGTHAKDSKWFHWLPLNRLKGETLEVKLPQQPERIYNRGVYVVPSSTEDLYKVGATYERAPFSEGTTDAAREMLQQQLKELLQMPFEIVHQAWGMRPTTIDRRPILGPHPANKNIIIFNGLGTKGVSLAPYFASRLATWLEGHDTIPDEVNINRFKALYSG